MCSELLNGFLKFSDLDYPGDSSQTFNERLALIGRELTAGNGAHD
ncbi:hypothetical protein C4K25_4478 [Pseudomonas chlororaphis]|nr:hypothetical protein C4K25_4478 [Pseudomonas chlororaphis]